MKIMHIVGARPNFMKVAPIMRELDRSPCEFQQILVHTGQHYDEAMSRVFFDDLELPEPDVNLLVGSGSHAWQTAQIMMRFEPVLLEHEPDWVFVPGDVNSTLACALIASKLNTRVAHVEAGLRSFDRTMPEEINRVLTDQISDLLLTPSPDANENLLREGIAEEKIKLVGNVMIDTLQRLLPKAQQRWDGLRDHFQIDKFVLTTLHRPANVDEPARLEEILRALEEVSREIPVVFPVHPRTRRSLDSYQRSKEAALLLTEPMSYLDLLALQAHAALVITDSGGLQEETTYLGIPCLTLRSSTERPITIHQGTNELVRGGGAELVSAAKRVLNRNERTAPPQRPEFWDGRTAERIVQVIRDFDPSPATQ